MEDNKITQEKSKKELYDEKQALKRAQREKELKKQEKIEQKKNKGYVNPISTVWGKILIWFLCFAMLAGIIFSFIYTVIIKK